MVMIASKAATWLMIPPPSPDPQCWILIHCCLLSGYPFNRLKGYCFSPKHRIIILHRDARVFKITVPLEITLIMNLNQCCLYSAAGDSLTYMREMYDSRDEHLLARSVHIGSKDLFFSPKRLCLRQRKYVSFFMSTLFVQMTWQI